MAKEIKIIKTSSSSSPKKLKMRRAFIEYFPTSYKQWTIYMEH